MPINALPMLRRVALLALVALACGSVEPEVKPPMPTFTLTLEADSSPITFNVVGVGSSHADRIDNGPDTSDDSNLIRASRANKRDRWTTKTSDLPPDLLEITAIQLYSRENNIQVFNEAYGYESYVNGALYFSGTEIRLSSDGGWTNRFIALGMPSPISAVDAATIEFAVFTAAGWTQGNRFQVSELEAVCTYTALAPTATMEAETGGTTPGVAAGRGASGEVLGYSTGGVCGGSGADGITVGYATNGITFGRSKGKLVE